MEHTKAAPSKPINSTRRAAIYKAPKTISNIWSLGALPLSIEMSLKDAICRNE